MLKSWFGLFFNFLCCICVVCTSWFMMQFIVPRHNSLSVSSTVCVLRVSFVHVCVHMCVLACGGKRLVWGVFLNEPLPYIWKQHLNQGSLDQIGWLDVELQGSIVSASWVLGFPMCSIMLGLQRCWGPTLSVGIDCTFPQSLCVQWSICTYLKLKPGAVFVFCELLSEKLTAFAAVLLKVIMAV